MREMSMHKTAWAGIFAAGAAIFALDACSTAEKNPSVCVPGKADQCPAGYTCNPDTYRCVATGDGGDGRPEAAASDVALDVPPDITPPDAPGTCAVDEHCAGTAASPTCVGGICKKCTANTDCAGRTGRGVCDTGSGKCVECVVHTECSDPAEPICVANACAACTGNAGCAARNPALPACDTGSGKCVECVTSAHCTADATKPVCTGATCAPCTSDSQCAAKLGANPGVCMSHQDGRCATDAETIYVKNPNGGVCPGADGTASKPYCLSQDGVNAVTSSRRLIAMRGPDALLFWSASPAGQQVTVVGQNGAAIAPGAAVGIHVSAGDVYIRNLTVDDGKNTGIVADSGATLRMSRCLITNNAKGGLIAATGAAFDIQNCVFDGNGPGFVAGIGNFGGASLGAAAGAGPAKFRNNTVVNSKQVGVICEKATQPITGLLLYMNTGGDITNCVLTSSQITTDGDPKFVSSSDYHLTATSPCRDNGDLTDFPADDIDGDTRPQGARSDCGADEYKP